MSIFPVDPRRSSTFSIAAAHVSGATGVGSGSGVGDGVATTSGFSSTGGACCRQAPKPHVITAARHTTRVTWRTLRPGFIEDEGIEPGRQQDSSQSGWLPYLL